MPEYRIRISPSQADDLAQVNAVGAETLREAQRRIASQKTTIKQDRVLDIMLAGLDPQSADALKSIFIGLSRFWSRDVRRVPDVRPSSHSTE